MGGKQATFGDHRRCSKCKELKPIEDFHKSNRASGGRCYICKPCRRKIGKTYHAENGKWVRMLCSYNLTRERYERILEKQGGTCAGCSTTTSRDSVLLAIDHDHACCPGKKSCGECIRGLLCDPCNQTLGLVRDSLDRLLRLALYLETHSICKGEE